MKKILVVAPHPDDETLGCGGTLLKHNDVGDQIYWLVATNMNERHGWTRARVLQRQKEIVKAAKLYGFKKTYKLNLPTTRLDTIPIGDIIGKFSSVFADVKPQIVYIPNRSDVHTDHQIVFKAAYSCTKNFRYPFVEKVLMYETLSETEFSPGLTENSFVPNYFNDITGYFEKKMDIMRIYASEIMVENLPRSVSVIDSLSRVRGARIGKKHAEAFCLLFEYYPEDICLK